MPLSNDLITGYHAHIYYNEASKTDAVELSNQIQESFDGATYGRWHDRPVGPHPDWSHQISFGPELFDQIIPFMAQNRNGLVIFIHPNTDNHHRDHRDSAIWMGDVRPLDLSIFSDS